MNIPENEDLGDSITIQDFPFICRICCVKRVDLRLFKEEYLLDIFQAVFKIDVPSRVEFPRNICNECINKLENISRFIYISKHTEEHADKIENGLLRQSVEATGKKEENISVGRSPDCRICLSSASNLTPFEDERLMQLFQNITNIDVKGDTNPSVNNSICSKCVNELENICTFVGLSICNDQKLESAIGIENTVKAENCSNPIDVKSSTRTDLELSSDRHEALSEITSTETEFVCAGEEEHEKFDINGGIIGSASREENGNGLGGASLQEMLVEGCRKRFECDFCDKSYTLKGNLKQHMVSHTGERPFECDCCKKSFPLKSSLRKHSIIHTGKKPFECEHCKRKFTHKNSWKQHLVTHTGEKNFKCDICEKRFAHRSVLTRHLLTHTGEKPFHCDSCLRSFNESSHLKNHKKSFHSEVSSATGRRSRAKLFQRQFECEMAAEENSPEVQMKVAYAHAHWEKNIQMKGGWA